MRVFFIDVGHTHTKAAYYTKQLGKVYKFKTNDKKTLNKLKLLSKKADVTLIAAVHSFGKALHKSINNSKLVKVKNIPMLINYDLNQLGVDRALSAYATLDFISPPFSVISMGSAVTIDFIDSKKKFHGGVIALGIHAMYDELMRVDKKLKTTKKLIVKSTSKSTSEAIVNGVYLSIIGLIKETLNKNKSFMRKPKLIFTGGDGKLFSKYFGSYNCIYIDNLVLKGLLKYHLYTII